jgi:hypothetical protein
MAFRSTPSSSKEPGPDRTFSAALDEANRDWHALSQSHHPTWTLDYHGMVVWWCSCPKSGPYNSKALDSHILTVTREARGPVRPPKK